MSGNLEKVGKVTEAERDEIKQLFQRKMALHEMVMVLREKSDEKGEVDGPLYQQIVTDLGENSAKFEQWWKEKADQYQWKRTEKGRWRINFDTCEIFLEG